MRLGIDLDGVCYNFDKALQSWIIEKGHGLPDDFPLDPDVWDLPTYWGITQQLFEEYCEAAVNDRHLFRMGEAYPNTVKGLQMLHDDGHEITIATSRRFGLYSQHNTMDWIHEQDIPYAGVYFGHDKTLLNVDILLDDYERHWYAGQAAGQRVVVMDRPYNRHLTVAERVHSMLEFYDLVDAES